METSFWRCATNILFSRDTLWVLGGNGLGQGLGLITMVLLSNGLGPAAYGRLALALGVMWIAAEITDLGMTVTSIRFGALYLKRVERNAQVLFRATFRVKIVAILIVSGAGWFMARTLSAFFFREPGLYGLFRAALVGAVGLSLWLYLTSYLQANQRFARNALFTILMSGIRLAIVILLVRRSMLTMMSGAWAYALSPFVVFLCGLWTLRPALSESGRPDRETYRSLLGFGRWVLVVLVSDMVYDRLDILMLSRMRGSYAVGLYAAAKRLALVLPMITSSVVTALLPKVSRFKEDREYAAYLRNALGLVKIWAPLTGGLLWFSRGLFQWVYRTDYAEGLGIFRLLIVILSLNFIIHPIALLLYARNRPNIRALVHVAQVMLNFIGNWFLIPRYGAEGAACASLVSTLGGGALILLWAQRGVPKGRAPSAAEQK